MQILAFRTIFPECAPGVFAELCTFSQPMSAHRHDFWELAFAIKGSGQHADEQSCMPLLSGDVWIIPPGQWHAYPLVRDSLSIFNLLLSDTFVASYGEILHHLSYLSPILQSPVSTNENSILLAEVTIPPIRFIRLSPQSLDQVFTLLNVLATEVRVSISGQSTICAGLVLQILGLLERHNTKEPLLSQALLAMRHDNDLLRTVQYIEERYADNLSLDTIARQSGYATTHLARKFRQALGITPMDYLLQVRLHHACSLLHTTTYPITQISLQTGFSDSRYFATRFRAMLGVTPTQFRERKGAGLDS